jgi:predicted hydrolase (HD superfamily)
MWSKSEKAIARKAFDAALKRELHDDRSTWWLAGCFHNVEELSE